MIYVNRHTSATTGAWPGYQPFGGWKGSSNTSKGAGGAYYLQQYLREQSQTYRYAGPRLGRRRKSAANSPNQGERSLFSSFLC